MPVGAPRISAVQVGQEREPVVIVDNAVADPARLVDCAAIDAVFAPPSEGRNFYPGVLAPAPLDYVGSVVRALDPVIREAFDLGTVKLGRATCNFSIVTTPPPALKPAQRLPHVDTVDPLQFAVLHYLCAPEFGGTGFYRHRSTGFETLTPDRLARYEAALALEQREYAPAGAYVVGDTPLFQQTHSIDAAFNRLIVYRSRLLHSGEIDSTAGLSADPRQGRLTANIFVTYRQH